MRIGVPGGPVNSQARLLPWGGQEGTEFLAEATFAGTEKESLRGWFPPQKERRWRVPEDALVRMSENH